MPHAAVGTTPHADTGTLRRYAGSTTVVASDVVRSRGHSAWDDLLAYTPSRPQGDLGLRDDEFCTRGTVGLYLTQSVSGSLDAQAAERLRSLLERFLPLNTRVVVRLAPAPDIERLYPPGADLVDTFLDKHPDIDRLGVPGERVAIALPGWAVLVSARPAVPPPADPAAGGTTADPAHPASLRFRSHAPPPE